jgi:hypothetical protein
MRIILSILALALITSTASAQDASTKKERRAKKTEAVAATPDEAAPKAGCCAGKASAEKASCHAKAEAKTAEAQAPDAVGTAALEAAPAAETMTPEGHAKGAACCAGKAKADCCAGKAKGDKAACHGKADGHTHDVKTEEAPAAAPNQ